MRVVFLALWACLCASPLVASQASLSVGISSIDFRVDSATLRETLLALPIPQSPTWRALLHYQNNHSSIPKQSQKSTFFLHKKGHKNPRLEYIATINSLINAIDSSGLKANGNEREFACLYPARLQLIELYLQNLVASSTTNALAYKQALQAILAYEQSTLCKGLQEFLALVPIDEIWLEFAAESDIYPGSSMGHIYLRLLGESQQDIDTEAGDTKIVRKKGDIQEYGMSYYAILSEFFNPLDYIRAMFGSLTGYYALTPYSNLSTEYLENQSRVLYRFKLESTFSQRELFRLHLWELKDRQIHYAFITHNCTDGIAQILSVLDSSYGFKKFKPFITPATYIKHLDSTGQIATQEWLAPPHKQKFINRFGVNDILHSYPNSKLTLGYEQGNLLSFYLAPIYSAITNADSSYKEHIESRLFAIEGKIALDSSLTTRQERAFLSQIELLHLYSLADFYRTHTLSKLISVRLESNLYQYEASNAFGAFINRQTRLFPTIESGLGFSAYARYLTFFALSFLGYRYEVIHNPYIAMRLGVIARLPRVKAIVESSLYYDILGNNRGYDSRLRGFLGINLYTSKHFALDVFVDSSVYWNLLPNTRIIYETQHLWQTKAGISLHF